MTDEPRRESAHGGSCLGTAVGKIVLGTLSDRLGIRRVLYAVIATELLLTSLLVQTRDPKVSGITP